MENINSIADVKTEELRQAASAIRKTVSNMKENLEKATGAVRNSENSYVASAAQKMRENYNNMEPQFIEFYNQMSAFANHLDYTADQFENAVEEGAKEAETNLPS